MSRGRCAPISVDAAADFGSAAYSAKPFLERMGILPARRNPEPGQSPADWPQQNYPLTKPLPPSPLQQHLLGENPPDRGQAQAWPNPTLESED